MTKNINLAPHKYDEYESEAIRKLTPYLVREFIPVTFHDYGFQTRIKASDELWKFADAMQEFRFESNLNSLLGGGFTKEEFELVQKITELTVSFTERLGNPVVGRNALTRALVVFRAIRALSNPTKSITILEVGPGSGFLALLCRMSGIKYYAMDVTQSFYIYQNNFWNYCLPGQLKESLNNEIPFSDFVHIPWWTWANHTLPLPEFDFVTINHAINEISPKGFMFTMRRISDSTKGPMLVEGWGGGRFKSNMLTLARYGSKVVHQQFSSRSSYVPLAVIKLPPTESFAMFPSQKEADVKIQLKQLFGTGIKKLLRAVGLLTAYNLLRRYVYETRSQLEVVDFCEAKISPVSEKLRTPKLEIHSDEIERFYSGYSGRASFMTADERFGCYIGSTAHHIKD